MNWLELSVGLDELLVQVQECSAAVTTTTDALPEDAHTVVRELAINLTTVRHHLQRAGRLALTVARMEPIPDAFECFTIAKHCDQLANTLDGGSHILHTNVHTGYAVVGMLLDHEQWQRERLGGVSLDGVPLYERFEDALDAANDPYGAT